MTTIAYKQGVMAADTQMTFGDQSKARARKITRLPDGSLLGCAGSAKHIARFREWAIGGFEAGKKPRLVRGEVEGLLVKPDGSIWYVDSSLDMELLADAYYAVGSGGQFALGALACGRNARSAVRIAARFDAGTSEPIEAIELLSAA